MFSAITKEALYDLCFVMGWKGKKKACLVNANIF